MVSAGRALPFPLFLVLQYVRTRNILTFQVGKAMYRDRVKSYPDEVYGTHGDAAFADYLWLASYTYRF